MFQKGSLGRAISAGGEVHSSCRFCGSGKRVGTIDTEGEFWRLG